MTTFFAHAFQQRRLTISLQDLAHETTAVLTATACRTDCDYGLDKAIQLVSIYTVMMIVETVHSVHCMFVCLFSCSNLLSLSVHV